MAIEVTLELVTLIMAIIAIVGAFQTIPKIRSDIVMGWRWIVLSLVVFAITQVYIILNGVVQDTALTLLGLIFIIVLDIGLIIHLVKLEGKNEPTRRTQTY